jgi:hypothetical protein
MRTLYYRERDGDYLSVSPAHVRRDEFGQQIYDGRATALAGLPASVCTTGIGEQFLAQCDRISRRHDPRQWLTALVG